MRAAPFVLEGEIDLSNGAALTQQLLEYAHGLDGASDLVLDCTDLKFIDSMGVRALVSVHIQSERGLVLKGMSENCRRVFQTTGLDQVFVIE